MLCYGIPYLFILCAITFNITHVVELVVYLVEFSALHSTCNLLVMVSTIVPYRKAVLDFLRNSRQFLKDFGKLFRLDMLNNRVSNSRRVTLELSTFQRRNNF